MDSSPVSSDSTLHLDLDLKLNLDATEALQPGEIGITPIDDAAAVDSLGHDGADSGDEDGDEDYDEDYYQYYDHDNEAYYAYSDDPFVTLSSQVHDDNKYTLPPPTDTTDTGAAANSSASPKPRPAKHDVLNKYRLFKRFDVVSDHSDHRYAARDAKDANGGDLFAGAKESPEWSKSIQSEWKLLEEHLPDSIFVRVYEERIDLMRAAIVGASGTPYHDGLFFFDILFPSKYPSKPPVVYYHSGGLRLNPNLYQSGMVCLSLLNTWDGEKNEKWNPKESNMLQVLLSIQALVLNEKPYFNEPGYERAAGTDRGEEKSTRYSETIFILSCKTMIYTLKRPPKHFEDLVSGHFCERAEAILSACKSYMSGGVVGFPSSSTTEMKTSSKSEECKSFKEWLEKIYPLLLAAFGETGADS